MLEPVGHFAEIVADRHRDDLASSLLDTAAPTQLRPLTEDIELHGVALPAGARIVLLPGAADRDPRVLPMSVTQRSSRHADQRFRPAPALA
ncbi:hypothetical protein [Actinomadura bangladeshensis]|uniref:Cytochrome P450 n=1 Tax=Actinomadura bangladeshensis TaxID=453573 RepID=A0A6L9QLM7_9ACTN|nr:hypothetical protein [Actinomadura bangladeshensis]NEA26390.1 hypothetical protein [Actinomadura bangladeshensis]